MYRPTPKDKNKPKLLLREAFTINTKSKSIQNITYKYNTKPIVQNLCISSNKSKSRTMSLQEIINIIPQNNNKNNNKNNHSIIPINLADILASFFQDEQIRNHAFAK